MWIVLFWTLISIFVRLLERSWWSPGAILTLSMWVSAVGTALMAPEFYMSFIANVYLMIMVLLVSFGTVIGVSMIRPQQHSSVVFTLKKPKLLFYFGLICSLASFFTTLSVIGVRIPDLVSPINIMRAAQSATFQRYTIGLSFPIYYNIFNALLLSYSMAICVHFVNLRKMDAIFMVPIFVYVLSNMLITTRAPILFMILLMIFTSIYVVYLRAGKSSLPELFSARVLKYIFIGGVLVAMMFFLFQILRFGEESNRTSSEVWSHLRRWPWGSLPGFSLWFDNFSGNVWARVPGSYTWMGVFDLVGIEERIVGGFSDYLFLTRSEAANIYTMFRGLYLDFGWVGSGVFMFIVGVIGGLSISIGRSGKPFFGMSLYVAVSCLMGFSLVISFWAFTANIIALLGLSFVTRMCYSRTRS